MRESPPFFDIVALAASAGGIGALRTVLGALPANFPSIVVVVQHLDPNHKSLLAQILGKAVLIPVFEVVDGQQLKPGHIYTAPPDRHLLVNSDQTATLARTELVHFVRPSADLLFESVAKSFGQRSIAAVLTGTGLDGSLGVRAIHKMGGVVLAQDRQSCEFFGMPHAAIQTGVVDWIIPLEQIAEKILDLIALGRLEANDRR